MRRSERRGPWETWFRIFSGLVVVSMVLGTVLAVMPTSRRSTAPTASPVPTATLESAASAAWATVTATTTPTSVPPVSASPVPVPTS